MKSLNNFSEQQVFELLEAGATLVTVNRRLARFSLSRYGKRQEQAGRTAWETPDVLPFSAWLERCWDRCVLTSPPDAPQLPMLLAPHQEWMTWQRIIKQSDSGKMLLHAEGAAAAAEQAWRLCHQWRVPTAPGIEWSADDPAAFLQWAAEFDGRCRRENWLDRTRLADAVREKFADKTLVPPDSMIFHGFDDISPQLTDLVKTLQQGGCAVASYAEDDRDANAVRVGLGDADGELLAAARWARRRLEDVPEGRIGVIVPRLEACREKVARVFDDVLHPETLLAANPPEDRIYNISLGRPLGDYPPIRTAFSLLSLITSTPDILEWTALLLSPYIAGGEAELPHRAALDARIRETGIPSLSIDRLIEIIDRADRSDAKNRSRCPELKRRLYRYRELHLDLPESGSPAVWTEAFSRVLDAFGWPGDRKLTSFEYQTVAAWQDALARFAELGRIVPNMSDEEALSAFRQMVGETLFQPEGGQVPVQVMGMLEAAGDRFDALWVLGLRQEVWPPAPSPNPFLPMALQRRMNLPHATPERELEYARQITRRLLGSARVLVVSYPLNDGDSPCYPSPLIEHLPEAAPDFGESDETADYRLQLAGSVELECLADWTAPPLEDSGRVAGGTGIIKAQAVCPFCACVGYRFGGQPLAQPVSGLDAAARGSLVHHALELVWDRLKTHAALMEKSREELEALVSNAVAGAIRPVADRRPETFTERFTALEHERVSRLVLEWLECEKPRMPFEVVEKESNRTVQVGGICLNTWVDRIDRLGDGRMVIIDYKTGQPKMADWFTERLIEPQLPLYSIAMTEPLGGVLFAQVRKGDAKFMGLADDEEIVAAVKAVADDNRAAKDYGSLSQIMADWKDRLEALAGELRSGHAAVSPAAFPSSCRYCHLACVCRIGELEYLCEADVLEKQDDT